jgi:hypothetical protein
VHKVARIVCKGNLDFGEVPIQRVGPVGLKYRIMTPPKDARWDGYPWRFLCGAGHDGKAGSILTDVPVEPALHVARPHEVVDPSLENGVKSILPMRPVTQEMADMRPAGVAGGGYQLRRVMHLMEGLVPNLIDVTGLVPATAHAVCRAIEEKQARRARRDADAENLHHVGADVVTDEATAINLDRVQQRDDILSERGGIDSIGRLRVRILALSETSKVRCYEPVAARKALEDRLPSRPELWPAVQQHQRRSGASLCDMVANPTCYYEPVLNIDFAHGGDRYSR